MYMKALVTALLLATAGAPSIAIAQDAPPAPSYGGRWKLDTAQSRDLPSFYANVREHLLDIRHDDSTLTVDVTIVNPERTTTISFPFRTDGKEVRTTTQALTPRGTMDIPTRLSAVTRPDGSVLVTIMRSGRFQGRERTFVGTEIWALRPDGALVINRVDEMPTGPTLLQIDARYVFVRA